ncbi:hypothetical protein [Polycladidibacter stylochi]|uniref:hypothetical protein n=1 Tax=Polycladidibacter stylochi TaxID=1807766 RepID=UPI00082EA905|nr:hypothetical protein [Pseudovibrio stylochi]
MWNYLGLWLSLLIMTIPSLCFAQVKQGDRYIIARETSGKFFEGHRVLTHYRSGYKFVQFCGQPYFVRPQTVVWSKQANVKGFRVNLEINSQDGWVVLCKSPEEQVTLKQVGIHQSLADAAKGPSPKQGIVNRFETIRNTFNDRSPLHGLGGLLGDEKTTKKP